MGIKNWYTLSREHIPKEIRDEGYDQNTWIKRYEIPITKNVETSSNDYLVYNGESKLATGSNLAKRANYW